MSPRSIHFVSFQWPSPPDYGGVIDVYHKIRALREEGWNVTLHSYAYRDRKNPDISKSPANETYLYTRSLSPLKALGSDPFIVASRKNRELLQRLGNLPAGTPIIFEGLHNAAFLSHPLLADKIKILRAHNVEHDYYRHLAGNSSGLKQMFYSSEAKKLEKYESEAVNADIIAAISPADADHFRERFPKVKTIHIPCFYDDSALYSSSEETPEMSESRYALYHGNLGVEENSAAVRYMLSRLGEAFSDSFPLVIAGRNASAELREAIEAAPNARLVDSPSAREMHTLIRDAAAVLLLTNQPTGIKLKLLDTLAQANGRILANRDMIADPVFESVLEIADTPDAQIEVLRRAKEGKTSAEEVERRRKLLADNYSTRASARRLTEAIDSLRQPR